RATAGEMLACRSNAREERVHTSLVRRKFGFARFGDGVEFLGTLARGEFRKSHVLKHRQQRIDDAGARRIGAADAMLDLLDQFVAMPRLLGEQRQNHEFEVALIEHAARPATMAKASMAPVAALAFQAPALAAPRPAHAPLSFKMSVSHRFL